VSDGGTITATTRAEIESLVRAADVQVPTPWVFLSRLVSRADPLRRSRGNPAFAVACNQTGRGLLRNTHERPAERAARIRSNLLQSVRSRITIQEEPEMESLAMLKLTLSQPAGCAPRKAHWRLGRLRFHLNNCDELRDALPPCGMRPAMVQDVEGEP